MRKRERRWMLMLWQSARKIEILVWVTCCVQCVVCQVRERTTATETGRREEGKEVSKRDYLYVDKEVLPLV